MSDRFVTVALLGAFLGGALLVMLAGGPSWLAIGYSAVGVVIAGYRQRRGTRGRPAGYRLRRGARGRPAGYAPRPRVNQAGELVLAPSPGRRAAPPAPVAPQPEPALGPEPAPREEPEPPEEPDAFEAPASEPSHGSSALGYVLVSRKPGENQEDP